MSEEKSVDLRFLEKLRTKLAEQGSSNHEELDQNNIDVCDIVIPESDKKRKLDNCLTAIISKNALSDLENSTPQNLCKFDSTTISCSKKNSDLGKKVPGATKTQCNKRIKLQTDFKKSKTETLSELDFLIFESSRSLVDLEDEVEASSLVIENGRTSPKNRKLTGTYLGLAHMHPTSALIRLCQHMKWDRPQFMEEERGGVWGYSVLVNGEKFVGNESKGNKKEAKVLAAKQCLETP